MTATIAYDKPVKNLIDQLSATGHVTHTAYRKTSVTIHHNGGRLSHEGVLDVWKTRPASAHFDVDSSGAIAQYVAVNEYAWAVGNKAGNQSTISIENANATLAPGWTVADVTWKASARLAGWLHFKLLGTRPTKDSLYYHHHWAATDCAGPYLEKLYPQVLAAAQSAYDSFKGSKPTTPSSPNPTTPTKKSTTEIAKDVIAGKYGNDPQRSEKLRHEGYNPAAVQAEVNRIKAGDPVVKKTVSQVANEIISGKGGWGNGPDRVSRLKQAGYNPAEVQAEVNRLMTPKGDPKPKLSISQVATQVLNGDWGNGDERKSKLTRAGYNYAAVQAEVNRRA